jgi:hypothetical protein
VCIFFCVSRTWGHGTILQVEHGKFWTALQLARRGTNFVFFEMDVWLVAPLSETVFPLHDPASFAARERLGLRLHRGQLNDKPPLTLVDRWQHAQRGAGSSSKSGAAVATANLVADLLVSTHQDVPFSMNIGFFSVQGNRKTAAFFARLLAKLTADPSLKDQRVSQGGGASRTFLMPSPPVVYPHNSV